MVLTAYLSRVTQYEATKDRYFHLAASSLPLPFVLPVVLALPSSSSYLLLSSLVGALLAVRCDPWGWRGGFWGLRWTSLRAVTHQHTSSTLFFCQDGRIVRTALFNRLVTSRLTSGARVNPDGSRKASVGSIAPG